MPDYKLGKTTRKEVKQFATQRHRQEKPEKERRNAQIKKIYDEVKLPAPRGRGIF